MCVFSPVHRKLHGSSDQRAASLSSPPPSPWGRSDGCHSTAPIASTRGHTDTQTDGKLHAEPTAKHSQKERRGLNRHLKVPPLLEDGDDGFVDVSDELVPLWFPQVVHAQLQLLYQGVLLSVIQKAEREERATSTSTSSQNWQHEVNLQLYGGFTW